MKLNQIYIKYKQLIMYLIFGALTTGINILTYMLCYHHLGMDNILSNVNAWILAVLFAFITNRSLVFHSQKVSRGEILSEVIQFVLCRLLTGILDIFIMFIAVDKLGCKAILVKVISNIIVIVLNYVASRMIIFYKKN